MHDHMTTHNGQSQILAVKRSETLSITPKIGIQVIRKITTAKQF